MRKYIAVLLALVMVLGLAACGGSSKPAETKPAEERQTSFTQMMDIALDTAVKMANL